MRNGRKHLGPLRLQAHSDFHAGRGGGRRSSSVSETRSESPAAEAIRSEFAGQDVREQRHGASRGPKDPDSSWV